MEDIQLTREKFALRSDSYRKVKSGSNNTFGGFILDDGRYVEVGNWVCHGWLNNSNLPSLQRQHSFQTKDVKYILSAVMKPYVEKEKLLLYMDWLINRSPWASIYVDKDVERCYNLGYVVSSDHPINMIGSGLQASRFFTESYDSVLESRAPIYQELLDIGCTENEAFLFTFLFAKNRQLYPITYSRYSSGHSVFSSSNCSKTYYHNFLTGIPVNLSQTFREMVGYGGGGVLNATWGGGERDDSFSKKVQALRPITLKLKEDFHIFRKAPTTSWAYTTREDFKSVVEQLKGLIHE